MRAPRMELECARHEGKVAEGLRGVAQLAFGVRIPFLAEQADVDVTRRR